MKIIDCEKQLHKSLKLFDDIYKYNNKISDILMKRGEKITFKEVCSIFECIYTIHKIMPYEFNSKYLKYFDNIDMNWLFKLKDDLKSLYDKINNSISIEAGIDLFIKNISITEFKYKYNTDTGIKNKIENISYVLNHLTTTKYNGRCSLKIEDDIHREFIDQLYEACLKYRSAAINYMNSLKLPTMTDWEWEESKKIDW